MQQARTKVHANGFLQPKTTGHVHAVSSSTVPEVCAEPQLTQLESLVGETTNAVNSLTAFAVSAKAPVIQSAQLIIRPQQKMPKCFRSQQEGHLAPDCTAQPNIAIPQKCFQCCRVDHMMCECTIPPPKCRERHWYFDCPQR